MSKLGAWRETGDRHWGRLKMDAARWVIPEKVVGVDQVTLRRLARLLWLYPSLRAMAWFRVASFLKDVGVRVVPMLIQQRLLTRFGLEIGPGADVGGGLYIAHPVGCTLVAERIGENVTVIGATTFGYKVGRGWPTIGDRAYFGVGARVLGTVHVGDDAAVGANAVVVGDVDDGTVVVGVPARPAGRAPALRAARR